MMPTTFFFRYLTRGAGKKMGGPNAERQGKAGNKLIGESPNKTGRELDVQKTGAKI